MQWTEQVEPERVWPIAGLAQACGLSRCLELLLRAQTHDLCVWAASELRSTVEEFLNQHKVEAGGLLLGRRFGSLSRGHIVSLERFVPGTDFEGTGVSLVLGSSIWNAARQHLDDGYSVIGWVHSHPNLGAFFSGTDRKTQRAFFNSPWQIGLCIDPVRAEAAWFYGGESTSGGLFKIW
jgi:proteasome lid subunit RPN8/RPN11